MTDTRKKEPPHNRHPRVPRWLQRVWARRVRARTRQRIVRCEDFDAFVDVKDKRVGNYLEWW